MQKFWLNQLFSNNSHILKDSLSNISGLNLSFRSYNSSSSFIFSLLRHIQFKVNQKFFKS